MNTLQQHAVGELRRIAAAILALGGGATVEQIVVATGLTRRDVARRLASGGFVGGAARAFACTRSVGRTRKTPPSVWSLTAHGREIAEDETLKGGV